MTLDRLIKELQKLQAVGLGRKPVSVDKDSLYDGNESYAICDVNSLRHAWVALANEDGGVAYRADGVERGGVRIILSGDTRPRSASSPETP